MADHHLDHVSATPLYVTTVRQLSSSTAEPFSGRSDLLENIEYPSLGRSLVNNTLAFQSADVLVRTIQDVSEFRKRPLFESVEVVVKVKNSCNLAGQRMLPIVKQMAYRFLLEQCGTSPSAPQALGKP